MMTKVFADYETIPMINEKARNRGMSYGWYVHCREQGMFQEDRLVDLKFKHTQRFAFCYKIKQTGSLV